MDEERGGLAKARVKEDPDYAVDVYVKIEAEVDEQPQPSKPELESVCPDPHVKLEAWEDGGLYADHEVSEDLVLGPVLLQQLCAAKTPTTRHHGAAERVATPGGERDAAPRRGTRAGPPRPAAVLTYMCDLCGNLFTKKRALIRHIKLHLQENPKMSHSSGKKGFSCETCGKRYFQSGHYNRHVRAHAGHKPHACAVCGRAFARADCLRVHRRVHSGQKPYSCEVCGKRFTQAHNLTRHLRVHTGARPYVCDVCFKSCSQSGDLKTHKRTHVNDNKDYSCDLCDRVFKRKTALVRHQQSHRRENGRDANKTKDSS